MNSIECNDVSIRYITGDLKSIGLKEYVVKKLTSNYHVQEFWADRHITFSLQRGDMLGIIGVNGAGKSTLLKGISGILLPAEGSIKVEGNIAALLELSSGFDNEMTLKENTYLRGAMLGYTREFLDSKYQEIIEFAELEEFESYQFKQLSSGMKSRLAFSIACLVNPDILILDEVLSVGDGAFRKKSGDKMKEIINGGITGMLVSHSVSQIRELCNKILWIHKGEQIAFTEDVEHYCDAYEEFLETKKLPHSEEDIDILANDHLIRMEEMRKEKEQQEVEKLQNILDQGESDEALKAAIEIIKKQRPEADIDYDKLLNDK